MRARDIIEKNYAISQKLNELISDEKEIAEKLDLIQLAARFNTECFTGKYTDPFLESELLHLSNLVGFPDCAEGYEENTTLHIMTMCYSTGGHTRVVYNWVNFDTDRKHSLFLDEARNIPPQWLVDSIENSGGSVIKNSGETTIEKALFLYQTAQKYEKIILHIHNWDIIPMLAFGNKKWRKPIFFYNHSSHLFWLGVSISDIVLELSSDTARFSKNRRGIRDNRILPIPIAVNDAHTNDVYNSVMDLDVKHMLDIPNDSFIITSMATDYKYTDFEPFNFLGFCEKVIELRDDIYFIIIGANPKANRWRDLSKKSKGRILPVGMLEKDEVAKIFSITDLYIDSFFFNSATCLLEAVAFNLPSVTLKTAYALLEATKPIEVDGTEQLLHFVSQYVEGRLDISEQLERVMCLLQTLHYRNAWTETMHDIVYGTGISHSVNTDFSHIGYSVTETDELLVKLLSASNDQGLCLDADLNDKQIRGLKRNGLNKKIIVWGAGSALEVYYNYLLRIFSTISYIVDNDVKKHGTRFKDIDIYPVETLCSENKEEIVVLVCSLYYYGGISDWLLERGFQEGINVLPVNIYSVCALLV